MKEIIQKIRQACSFERIVVRLIMAWLLTTLVYTLKYNQTFTTVHFAADINIAMYACFVLLFFAMFCLLAYFNIFVWAEIYGPTILMSIYAMVVINNNYSIGYAGAVLVFVALSVVYAVHKSKSALAIESKKIVLGVYVAAAVFYLGITCITTVYKITSITSSTFDMGIWTQMFNSMKNSFMPMTTCERNVSLSHFAIHFSPIYYLYLPFFMIAPSAVTIQILQAVTVISGLIPVYLLCRKMELSKLATIAFGLIYALFPSLACGCYYDLHENCFLAPLIMWLLYYLEKDNMKGIVVFSLLIFMVKEDAPVYVACIGLYMILSKKKYLKGVIMMGLSIAAFLVITGLINKFGYGIQDYRYSNFSEGEGNGLIDVVKNFITNPAYTIKECFDTDRLEYIFLMFLPVGFLPFASKKISRLILLIPMLLVNLASDVPYQHSIFFQYTFGVASIIIYMSIINYKELSEKPRMTMSIFAICASVILLPAGSFSRLYYVDSYYSNYDDIQAINAAIATIPEDATVTASTFFVTPLAYREEVYDIDSDYGEPDPARNNSDYVMIDLRYDEKEKNENLIKKTENGGFHEIQRREGVFVLLKRDE